MYRHIFITEHFESNDDSFISNFVAESLNLMEAKWWRQFFPDAGGSSHYIHGYLDHVSGDANYVFDDIPCKVKIITTKLV